MAIHDGLQNNFDELVRARGMKLFSSGHVLLKQVSQFEASAQILGLENLQVFLKVSDDDFEILVVNGENKKIYEALTGYCSCGQFQRIKICEHICALSMALDETVFGRGLDFPKFMDFIAMKSAPDRFEKTDSSLRMWRQDLSFLRSIVSGGARENLDHKKRPLNAQTQSSYIWYVVEPLKSDRSMEVYFYERKKLKDGTWGRPKKINLNGLRIESLSDRREKKALRLMKGGLNFSQSQRFLRDVDSFSHASLHSDLAAIILDLLHSTGRLGLIQDDNIFETRILSLSWSPQKTVRELVQVFKDDEKQLYKMQQTFVLPQASEHKIPKSFLFPFFESHLALWGQEIVRLKSVCPSELSEELFKRDEILIPYAGEKDFVGFIRDLKYEVKIELPEDFPLKEEVIRPIPVIEIEPVSQDDHFNIYGRVGFEYDGIFHRPFDESSLNQGDDLLHRIKDLSYEQDIIESLRSTPDVLEYSEETYHFLFDEDRFNDAVESLKDRGFEIRAFGKKLKSGCFIGAQVRSHHDWFDVKTGIQFESLTLTPPEILKRLEANRYFVQLNRDEIGFIPNKWLEKVKVLSQLSTARGGGSRLPLGQALILDEIFGEDLKADQKFKDIVAKMRGVDGLKLIRPSRQFAGELRSYQRVGLSWLNFLEEIGLGGCLADEMGLGKTIQVLSYIQKRKQKKVGPFLIVLPKSLMGNWESESRKFTPNLVVSCYEGRERKKLLKSDSILTTDILLVTYGILRQDIKKLKEIDFDGVILDEAQNIKNAKSLTAKAAYSLKGEIRLALTGTPIENHIGELFSLFQFLIPGLFKPYLTSHGPTFRDETLEVILRGLRPFILRRKKEDVLKELPAKTENIIYCEFGAEEKKEYQKLKSFYQGQLSEKVKELGLKRTSFHVLEGLLRLRQFSCHPKLINKDIHLASSKLDTLIDHLQQIKEAGKKALVFSQFTSFLKIVSNALDTHSIKYAYLDGQTKNRDLEINQFKEDSSITSFLISLKAGGVGLNLTCASYCFILDPWWNPAVENQAIDRVHRIGQSDPVFVYRLITRDSVEQRVVELQQSKRELGQDVLASDKMFLSQLSQADFIGLLS